MTLKNVTEAKTEKVTELWLWEHFDGKDRKISDNHFLLKKHIEKTYVNPDDGQIVYRCLEVGTIFVEQKGRASEEAGVAEEIGVIKKVKVI